jgi:flagellar biosynthesis protein FlhG
VNKVAIICNQVRDEYDGLTLFQRFSDVTNRFLNINLDYWGSVNYDAAVKRSTIHQRLILKQEPLIETSQRILKISDNLEKSLAVERPQSGLSFFMETAIGVA